MFFTYTLISTKTREYYIGYTKNVAGRLKLHNDRKVISTKHGSPWKIFHREEFKTEQEAIKRERQIKNWKSRKATERLKFYTKIEDPRFRFNRNRDHTKNV